MFSRLISNCAFYRSTRPSRIWRAVSLTKRHISSTTHTDETISIPVGGDGSVILNISRPTRPAKNNNVLVYLPPGPFPRSSRRDTEVLNARALRDVFPDTTIVDLRYRVSLRNGQINTRPYKHTRSIDADPQEFTWTASIATEDHRFPTPIHDVFTAWTYITESLKLYNHDIVDGKKIYYRPRIYLLGSHIGGSLALTLALTDPNAIRAVAVIDAVGDWTGLDEIAATTVTADGEEEGGKRDNKRGRKKEKKKISERERLALAAREFLRLRGHLFRSHSGYFDAFASPVLFLRAPGRDTPVERGGIGLAGAIVEESAVVMRYGEEVDEVGIVVDDKAGHAGQAFGPYDDDWHVGGYDAVHCGLGKDGKVELIEGLDLRRDNGADGTESRSDSSILGELDSSSARETSSTGPTATQQNLVDAPGTPPGSASSLPSSSPPTAAAATADPPSSPRRRKVLRRWPPTAQPEDVMLPYINLFTTTNSQSPSSSTSETSILADHTQAHDTSKVDTVDTTPLTTLQSQELQDLLRKACFWGREKSLAEERVVLTRLGELREATGVGDGEGRGEVEVGREGRELEREKVVRWLQMRFDGDE